MAATVPTSVPTTVRAGDTAEWTISLNDFRPGDGWTLSYALTPFWGANGAGGGSVITFSATASGNDHAVNVVPATTETWIAGKYAYQATVYNGTKRHTVDTGEIEILPDLSTAGLIDPRSKARRIVDFLERTMERWSNQQVSKAIIEGVSFEFRTWGDLQKAHAHWLAMANAEEEAANGGWRRAILAEFTRPQ